MGNCQAAEAAAILIQHPDHKIERIYCSISANEVMGSNPGHYVALIMTSPTMKNENGLPVKQLKLLRPDDTLLIGQVYRLISFEDVLKEFAAKKCVKLGKLLEKGGFGAEVKRNLNPKHDNCNTHVSKVEHELANRSSRVLGRSHGGGGGGGQWRPALQSIAEVGI